jgi:hypothetical protein
MVQLTMQATGATHAIICMRTSTQADAAAAVKEMKGAEQGCRRLPARLRDF